MFTYFKIHRRARRWLFFAGVQTLAVSAVIAAFVYRGFLDGLPGDGRLSACAMHDLWHIYCPGCGGTRAMIALFRGQLLHSLACNPLSVYIAVGFVFFDIRAAIAIARDEHRVLHLRAWYFWVMLALAVVFFVARNLLLVRYGVDYLGDLGSYWHP